jgi:hypothetical protein
MSRQAIPILSLTVLAAAALTAHRFVTGAGAVCGAGGKALGLLHNDAASGDAVAATVVGTAIMESGAAIAKDAEIQSDALGRGITATTGPVLARALEAASGAGELIEVLVLCPAAMVADAAKLAQVLASNDVTAISANGAVPISGVSLVAGGTGLAGLTLAAPQPGCQVRLRVASLASGNVVTTTAAGVTFDGTNNTAAMNAVGDELVLGYKSATEWHVIENTSTTLSAV